MHLFSLLQFSSLLLDKRVVKPIFPVALGSDSKIGQHRTYPPAILNVSTYFICYSYFNPHYTTFSTCWSRPQTKTVQGGLAWCFFAYSAEHTSSEFFLPVHLGKKLVIFFYHVSWCEKRHACTLQLHGQKKSCRPIQLNGQKTPGQSILNSFCLRSRPSWFSI